MGEVALKCIEKKHSPSAYEARFEAQRIAFAPVVFQVSKTLRDEGILKRFCEAEPEGLLPSAIEDSTELSRYAVRILLEAGESIGLLQRKGEWLRITKVGHFIESDPMTRVNMNFVQDVCYQGLFHLSAALRSGKPEGLKVFGEWPTIYEGLAELPTQTKQSWFAFDHFYSDTAFRDALKVVQTYQPKSLLDIGGNTGRWLEMFLGATTSKGALVDLPNQIKMAQDNLRSYLERVQFFELDLLKDDAEIPSGFDAIWMSQFLDCFSPPEIISILRRVRKGLAKGGKVFILETFSDRQSYEQAKFCLTATSMYFTAMANGNSQMYESKDFLGFLTEAGFRIVEERDGIGLAHTLLVSEGQ